VLEAWDADTLTDLFTTPTPEAVRMQHLLHTVTDDVLRLIQRRRARLDALRDGRPITDETTEEP
jgi:hypothetical protein